MLKNIINATNKTNARLVDLILIGQSRGLNAQEFKELMQLDAIAEELEECLNNKATE